MQAALKLVLEPIVEADFQPCSYGFRPRRRAQDAIADTDKPAGNQTLVKVWTKSGSHYLTVDESSES